MGARPAAFNHVPALIDVRTELPYNETGKLLRRVLKAEAIPGASG